MTRVCRYMAWEAIYRQGPGREVGRMLGNEIFCLAALGAASLAAKGKKEVQEDGAGGKLPGCGSDVVFRDHGPGARPSEPRRITDQRGPRPWRFRWNMKRRGCGSVLRAASALRLVSGLRATRQRTDFRGQGRRTRSPASGASQVNRILRRYSKLPSTPR